MKQQSIATMDKVTDVVRLPHSQAHVILENHLSLAPAHQATNEQLLREDGITHVLNVAIDVETQQFSNIQVLHLQLYDSPNQELPLDVGAKYIADCIHNGGHCLVHCNAGQSRSASIILYFFIKFGNYTLQQAWQYCKARKPDIRPNFGFVSQLEKQEVALRGKSSFDLTEYKADSIMDILEGSGILKEQVMSAIQEANGNANVALESLLT